MHDQQLSGLIKSLGAKIRVLRKERGIRLRELSSKTRLSIGALSQIERGIMTPSLSSMVLIAHSLETPMGHFFDPSELPLNKDANGIVTRKGKEELLHSSNGLSVYLLHHDEAFGVEIVKNVFEASASTGETKYQHEGEEWGVVLRGLLKVELEDETYVLKAGDSIHFKSDIPHRLININEGKTVQIWFNSPPLWINRRA
jgi:transcriptional regulator with XRE-family HTH domain